jgi:CubicO group peptidase (beta-lactamase class C family)
MDLSLETATPLVKLVARLEKRIPQLMENAAVPGLSIALVRDAELTWSRGFGFRDVISNEPVTANTLFEAASISKPVFAYLALKLCQDGVLDLDTPLVKYLPSAQKTKAHLFGFIINEPRLHLITMRHVLSHTPGFPNWAPEGENLKIHFTPGERFSYSGEGYVYLQRVIEGVTGQAAHKFIRANLLEPLGMRSSRYTWTAEVKAPVAQGHDEHGQPQKKRPWPEMNAAASLHCTPTDLARFMIAVMRPSPDNPFQLNTDSIAEMLRPHVQVNDSAPWCENWPREPFKLNDTLSWGLGWGIQHHGSGGSFWHWGDNGPFKAFAVGFKEQGIGAVVMANSVNGPRIWRDVLYEAIGGEYPAIDWLESIS